MFNRLREGIWWRAPVVSSLIGSLGGHRAVLHHRLLGQPDLPLNRPMMSAGPDEMLPLLGCGPVSPLWVSLAFADWMVKLALALI